MLKTCFELFAARRREGNGRHSSEEREFFSAILLDNKVSKMTWENRLDDLNDRLLLHIGDDPGTLGVMDVGMSSGVSTYEMFEAIARKRAVSIVGTDYCIYAYLIEIAPGLRALVQRNGFPLQYDVAGLAIRPWPRRRYMLTGWPLVLKVAKFCLRRYLRGIDFPTRVLEVDQGDIGSILKVALITSKIETMGEITYCEDDLLTLERDEFHGRFDVIRAANVLNRLSFSDDQLLTMLRRLRGYLKGPGAILLVSRSHADHSNHGTFFRLTPDGGSTSLIEWGADRTSKTLFWPQVLVGLVGDSPRFRTIQTISKGIMSCLIGVETICAMS